MKPSRHDTPFKPGDRVGFRLVHPNNEAAQGTFVEYCRGYLSHCIVQWDGGATKREAAHRLRLIDRNTEV